MLTDSEVGAMVRAALDEVNEPAPWLSTVVRNELRTKQPRPKSWMAPVSAAVIAALVAGLIAAVRFDLSPPPPVGPSRDPGILSYRALVDGDLHDVDRLYAGADCLTRARCIASTTATRDATRKLVQDLSAAAPPEALNSQATLLATGATRFLAQLNAALESMANPNSDYLAASSLPDITQVDLAAARIDCWPVNPVLGEHGIDCS